MAKKEKQHQLVEFLSKFNHPVTGQEISNVLGISARTVRKYINQINENDRIISSNKKGYYLPDPEKAMAIVNKKRNNYDFTSLEERIFFIIFRIIKNKEPLDLYDLAYTICVSNSTIEKDVHEIKQRVHRFKLNLLRKKGKVWILGSEKDKRTCIRQMIFHMNLDRFSRDTITYICKAIHFTIQELSDTIRDYTAEQGLYCHDYAIFNIAVFLAIALYRINDNFFISADRDDPAAHESAEYISARNIFSEIKQTNHLLFSNAEVYDLSTYIHKETINLNQNGYKDTLRSFVPEQVYISFTKNMIEQVHTYYVSDLYDEDFIHYFSLHLKKTIVRCKSHIRDFHPFASRIYVQNPYIYEIATFIGYLIENRFNCTMNINELTFIAMHVGRTLGKKRNTTSFKCQLIIDSYYYPNEDYRQTLQSYFHDRLIIADISNAPLSENNDYDLIINATWKRERSARKIINVSPLLDENDMIQINSFINKKILNMYAHKQTMLIDHFFNEKLFEIDHYEPSTHAMIDHICAMALQVDYIDPTFCTSVHKREQTTNTAVNDVMAIPHTVVIPAKKSFVYLVVNRKSMRWGSYDVHIIAMIGISTDDRAYFKDIYNFLFQLSQNETLVGKLNELCTFDKFSDYCKKVSTHHLW